MRRGCAVLRTQSKGSQGPQTSKPDTGWGAVGVAKNNTEETPGAPTAQEHCHFLRKSQLHTSGDCRDSIKVGPLNTGWLLVHPLLLPSLRILLGMDGKRHLTRVMCKKPTFSLSPHGLGPSSRFLLAAPVMAYLTVACPTGLSMEPQGQLHDHGFTKQGQ